ncbi:MAG: hypothetical protein AAF223_08535, partial [Bacteroidota bacterium]
MMKTVIQSEVLTSYGGLVSIALVLMLGCLALVLVLYIHRALAMARKKKADDLQFRYQYLLYDALVESQSENASDTFLEIALQLFRQENSRSGSLKQQVLTDIILNLKKSLTGAAQDQLLELAYALGLPEYAQKKLRQQSFNIRTQGLHEVTAMQINSTEIRHEIAMLQQAGTSQINQEVILAL